MIQKDDITISILKSARQEFFKKGYADASMRNIAKEAGLTTGSLYNRFLGKGQIFRELVGEAADNLYNYFKSVQDNFADIDVNTQLETMYEYTDDKIITMVEMIYNDFDSFKLIISKSAGSEYENFVDRLICIETESTVKFIDRLNRSGYKVNRIGDELNHIISSALFNGFFEIVSHDMQKEYALDYVKTLKTFFRAGWSEILGIPYK